MLGSSFGPDGESEASIGPPTTEVHVPSNLEVDENSWFTNVYTFSPVWQPPMKIENDTAGPTTVAVTEAERIKVESCYDESSKSVQLSFEFKDIEAIPTATGMELPWMAIGYRQDEVCSMIPLDGGDTGLVMISKSSDDSSPNVYMATMGPNTKRFDPNAISGIYESFQPLEATFGFKDISLATPMLGGADGSMITRSTSPNGSVILSFSQQFVEKPDAMHLMYAIGMSATLGIHESRSCFDIVEFPSCSTMSIENNESIVSNAVESDSSSSATTPTFNVVATAVLVLATSLCLSTI